MPSPPGAGAGTSPGVKSGGGQKNESLTPLTVKQLHQAVQECSIEDSIKVDGDEVHSLSLVGRVIECSDSATLQVFTIDDGTGVVEVRYWLEDDNDISGSSKEPIKKGTYVRVYGHLRSFQGQRNIVAFTIRPVTDFNEVTYHLLETIFVHLGKTKGQAGGGANPTTPVAQKNISHASAYHTPQQGHMGAGGNNMSGQEICQQQVLKLYEEPHALTDVGMNLQTAESHLGSRFTHAQIREAVETLVADGHLYSTIDDDHFRSTAH